MGWKIGGVMSDILWGSVKFMDYMSRIKYSDDQIISFLESYKNRYHSSEHLGIETYSNKETIISFG